MNFKKKGSVLFFYLIYPTFHYQSLKLSVFIVIDRVDDSRNG